jgi:ADP-ribose pyrophosphatase
VTGEESDAERGAEASDRWPVHDTEIVWETPYFAAGYDTVERPSGERADYYWLEPADAAMVVAPADGDVLMVEQYRPRQKRRVLGVPAGLIEDDETPDAAARRELREETGYVAEELTHLETYFPSGWVRYVRHVFVAEAVTPGDRAQDDGEFITVERVPADDAIDRVRQRAGPTNGGALTPLVLAREAGYL